MDPPADLPTLYVRLVKMSPLEWSFGCVRIPPQDPGRHPMIPSRKAVFGVMYIREFYVDGWLKVYVNHYPIPDTFDEAVAKAKAEIRGDRMDPYNRPKTETSPKDASKDTLTNP